VGQKKGSPKKGVGSYFTSQMVPQPNLGNEDIEVLGFNVHGSKIVVVATRNRQGNELDAPTMTVTAAHELGHALGLGHTNQPNHLMTANLQNDPDNLYELDKSEWDTINP
jgi:hypothetical protein